MAIDSIIARPTNRVRVMVVAASGCCASALKAVETARPSPSAGAMLPTAIVTPAVIIDTIAINVMLSIRFLSCYWPCCFRLLRSLFYLSGGGRDVDGGEDAED